jgi:hypothetical protein
MPACEALNALVPRDAKELAIWQPHAQANFSMRQQARDLRVP